MDNPTGSQSVRVAVNIRPLLTHELLVGCSDCISVTPGEPQVQIGARSFTFDYVYGSTGSTSSRIFDDCVAPLVDAFFDGYNATVLAYGQTGSGKTHTMGTNYNVECTNGIIPKVMQTIFRHVEETIGNTEYLIRVSFIEVFKEEVFDLLESSTDCTVAYSKGDGNGKGTGPSRAPIQIRETANGGISLAGVTEAEVTSQEEMALFLQRGCVCRATGSTNMNSKSSRSHAIFTISMEQKRNAGDEILSAKLHDADRHGPAMLMRGYAFNFQLVSELWLIQMARCGSGYLNRRIADRGNDGGASGLFDHEVEQPQRLAWLTPGLGAVDRVERLQHLVPGLGLVLSSALEETKLVEPVWDESTRDEEYLTNGDFIYDSQPVYDEYADEEWYSLFIHGDRNLSGRKLVEGGARLGGDGIGVATVGDLPNLKVPMFQPPTTESLNFEPQANNLRMSNSNGSMMNTVGKVKLFMEVMMIIMKGNHVDVPFDPGGSFLRHIKTRGRVFFEGEENDADRHGPTMLMRGYAFNFQVGRFLLFPS